MKALFGWLVAIVALPLPAQAGIKATYVSDVPGAVRMAMTITIDDAGRDRIDMVGNGVSAGSVIYRDGESYIVQRDATGAAVVMRVSDATTVMREGYAALTANAKIPPGISPTIYRIVDLGAETVGARAGTRYALKLTGPGVSPEAKSMEFVISSDPALAPIGRIWARQMLQSTQGMTGIIPPGNNMPDKTNEILAKGTMLRYGQLMHLDTVETVTVDAATFDLPATPLTLDQVRARFAAPQPPSAKP